MQRERERASCRWLQFPSTDCYLKEHSTALHCSHWTRYPAFMTIWMDGNPAEAPTCKDMLLHSFNSTSPLLLHWQLESSSNKRQPEDAIIRKQFYSTGHDISPAHPGPAEGGGADGSRQIASKWFVNMHSSESRQTEARTGEEREAGVGASSSIEITMPSKDTHTSFLSHRSINSLSCKALKARL